MLRLLLWPFLLPFRLLGALSRKLFLWFRGYNVVRLHLHGSLPDEHSDVGLLGAMMARGRGPTLLDTLIVLDRARRDPRVEAVLVEVGPLHCGVSRAEEVREALTRVRDAGKKVWIFLEDAGLAEYLLALGAGRIVLAPAGTLNVNGLASEVMFLKGLLDKAGVKACLTARGKYKSARETFTEASISEANREMTTALVDDLYNHLVEEVTRHRKISEEEVRSCLDRGPFRADQAVEAKLADGTGYLDDLADELEENLSKYRPLKEGAYLRLSSGVLKRGKITPIAMLEVSGHIKSGRSVPGADGQRATGSRTFVKQVERALDDPSVKAVLLRVDSPGGSGLASDVMWHALKKLAAEKPVVISMSNVAASGGYYVSALPGMPILATGSTITGSIGVLGGKFALGELYSKLGVKKEIIARGKRASYHSDYMEYTAEELEKLNEDIEAFYKDFVTKMAECRGRPYEDIDAVAQGRVWTGRQALEHGLADKRGGLLAALAEIRVRLNLDEEAPLGLIHEPGERKRWPIRIEWDFTQSPLSELLGKPLQLAQLFSGERIFALLPFDIRFR